LGIAQAPALTNQKNMADADLLSYIGAVGGIVGAFTGIAGAVIAYVSYKKTEQLKVLDLRIELGKTVVSLIEEVDELPRLLEYAKKSRLAVAAATGMSKSGATEQWGRQWQADEKSLASLQSEIEELNANHGICTTKELEEAIIAAHLLQKTVTRIRQSYEQYLAEDDKNRDGIHQAARDRVVNSGRHAQ